MAHSRRKFFDLMEAHQSPVATEAVERIALLYAIEREIMECPIFCTSWIVSLAQRAG
jgi:hypothetical protein